MWRDKDNTDEDLEIDRDVLLILAHIGTHARLEFPFACSVHSFGSQLVVLTLAHPRSCSIDASGSSRVADGWTRGQRDLCGLLVTSQTCRRCGAQRKSEVKSGARVLAKTAAND